MNDRLKTLYKTVILKHNNDPVHFSKNESAQYILKANSPICGDRFTLFFDVENGVIKNLSFYGHGCAVSKASTSILVEKLRNQPIGKALKICTAFYDHINPENVSAEQVIEAFEAFSAVKHFPERIQCATLSWDEVTPFLKTQQ
jgi:nitrogen fixation protein NifU and related proteins